MAVGAPADVHHRVVCVPSVDLEVVLVTPVHKVLDQSSGGPVAPICDEANNGRVVTELLQLAGSRIVASAVNTVKRNGARNAPDVFRHSPSLQSMM